MERLRELHRHGRVEGLELHFSSLLTRLARVPSAELALAAWLVSRRQREGHSCVELRHCAGQLLEEDTAAQDASLLRAPPLESWCRALRASGVVGSAQEEPAATQRATAATAPPLIRDAQQRLYLHRYWEYEERIATQLLARAARSIPACAPDAPLARQLAALFPQDDGAQPVWQRVAAAVFLLRGLCVISGGPGTGKTTAMAGILRVLLQNSPTPLRVALAAPTGKAALRMQPILQELRASEELPAATRQALAETPVTLHRLLGTLPESSRYRHHRDNPLPLDVLVVDECSMIDIALMAHLLDALPSHARLLLLGDRNQLAAVESGALLGDLCSHSLSPAAPFRAQLEALAGCRLPEAAEPSHSPLRDVIVMFQRTYRFSAHSPIGRMTQETNNGNAAEVLRLLRDSRHTSNAELRHDTCSTPRTLEKLLRERIVEYFRDYLDSLGQRPLDAAHTLEALQSFRVLAIEHGGPYGVRQLNARIEAVLRKQGALEEESTGEGPWYHGRPVMVQENNYFLQLFNGDMGVCLRDAESGGQPRVFFPHPEGGTRDFAPSRLPRHDTAFAMTVHKSQGTEFDSVLLVLPPHSEHALLVRELLYTGLSRPRRRLHLCGAEASIKQAVLRRYSRASGLRRRLWGEEQEADAAGGESSS